MAKLALTEPENQHLLAMRDSLGGLTPEAVVADARRKDSPIHHRFPWDLKKAAMQHWLYIGRTIIGSVTYQFQTSTTIIKVPAYVRDPGMRNEQGYRTVDVLKQDPVAARAALMLILQTAAGHLQRGLNLAEPLGLQSEIDELIERITGLRKLIHDKAA